jgi:N-acyl-D-amino-acid deacylase
MANQLVIKGGTVYDGSGAAGTRADVGIADGRITEVGANVEGERVLDAGDCVVAPGFIDIHTHYDAQVFWDPALTPSCYHGVTTVVAGNCGFSIAPTRAEHHELIARTLENVEDMDVAALAAGIPWDFATFPEYLASVANHGVGINFAAYIGHTALRLFVMGDDAYERTATAEEIAAMQQVLREAMEAGAAGFATSFAFPHRGIDGKPVPSRFADRVELEALLATMGEVGRGVVSIAPGEQCGPADMFDLQLKVGVPFTWGALLTSPTGYHRQALEANRAGWERGSEVWPQVTPRPLTFQFTLDSPYPLAVNEHFAALQNASIDERTRAYADPAWRERMMSAWSATGTFGLRWDTYTIGESEVHPDLVDRKLVDVAAERGVEPLTRASSVTRPRPPTCSASGCATRAWCRWSTRSASSAVSRPTCSASPTAATCGPGCAPMSRCSTPRPWHRGRCGGCATSRPTPSASPPTSRRGCSTSW